MAARLVLIAFALATVAAHAALGDSLAAQELGLTPEGAEQALERFASTTSQSVFVAVDDEGETVYRFPTRLG